MDKRAFIIFVYVPTYVFFFGELQTELPCKFKKIAFKFQKHLV